MHKKLLLLILSLMMIVSSSLCVLADDEETSITNRAGYYLVASDATFDDADMLKEGIEKITESTGKVKYYYTKQYNQGEKFTVTSIKPKRGGYVFLGWFDKQRKDTDGTTIIEAKIRSVGESVKYVYKTDNYCLDALWATLNVTDYEGTYDGQYHSISEELVIDYGDKDWKDKYGKEALSKVTVVTEYSTPTVDSGAYSERMPGFKAAGEYKVKVKKTVKVGKEEVDLLKEATVKINKLDITVHTDGAEKTYDGKPLTNENCSIDGMLAEEKQKVALETNGSQTQAGDSKNTYALNWNGVNENNYNVIEDLGVLKVNKKAVNVTINGKNKTTTYNGESQSLSGYDVLYNDNLYSEEYIKYTGDKGIDGTDAGEYDLVLDEDDFSNSNSNFDVTFVVNNGKLVINKAKLTVTTSSASKAYDGKALEASGKIDGFVNSETASFKTTGSQLAVGSSKNTYSIDWDKASAKKDNYYIEEHLGTLTVSEASKSDSNNTKVVTCEEAMNSKNWTWSESKKACVYRVTNTSAN